MTPRDVWRFDRAGSGRPQIPLASNGRAERRRHRFKSTRELRSTEAELAIGRPQRDHFPDVEDFELIAQELSGIEEKIRSLEERLAEVERVNARLEDAPLATAHALGEVFRHWDAVYEAMRRPEIAGKEDEEELDLSAT